MEKIKWGIRGTGHIANHFAQGLQENKDSIIQAVVSRNLNSAKEFSEKYNGELVFDDFDQMLKEADIDVLYIATPNNFHYSEIMKALDAGVNVLSEKPMVDNHKQFSEVIAKAKEKNLFLLEGMWTRFFPAMKQAVAWIAEGKIGEVINVSADFSYALDPEKDQPWKAENENNAGALRDVGIYSIAFADQFFPQKPNKIEFSMTKENEVDQRTHLFFDYGDGKVAFLSCGFTHHGSSTAEIVGSTGKIQIGPEFWRPTTAKIIRKLDVEEEFHEPYLATGFQFEVAEVVRCLRAGLKESPDFTWQTSERIADIIEEVRKDGGIFYDSDKDNEV
ncbi:MAG: Gfo/Idh/MocA family oxidoreductase [Clostridiaceae bacterium]|nr:Gfo/Idh/MocA family oxidoreductase [Clostridiaceae bacterium]